MTIGYVSTFSTDTIEQRKTDSGIGSGVTMSPSYFL